MNRVILPLTGLALLLAALGCGSRKAAETAVPPPARVRLASSQEAGSADWVAATLTATRRAVLSTRMAASVKKVHVNEGQKVAAGTLLVSLADEDLQGGLKAAEAALAAAQAQARRMENLMKAGASTAAEQDMARTQLAQAQAGLAQVKANLAYTRIRAPFSGVVQARRINDGDFVGPGSPLVELEGQGALELVGSVSEAEARGLKLGQKLPFEAEGLKGEAVVTALATGGDPVSHRGALRARVIQPREGLRSGSFARLRLPSVPASPAGDITVPASALVQRGELTGVFVVRDGKAELRWLSLGERQGDRYPVRAGLSKGEAVIDAPGALRDGQRVEVAQ